MSLQLIREALENANAIMPCPLYKEALDAARKMDESHVPDGPWRANVILSGYQANGYSISRDDEKPIARTILVDEVDDEAAAELIVNALNSYKGQ